MSRSDTFLRLFLVLTRLRRIIAGDTHIDRTAFSAESLRINSPCPKMRTGTEYTPKESGATWYVVMDVKSCMQQSYTNQVKTRPPAKGAKPRHYDGHLTCQDEVCSFVLHAYLQRYYQLLNLDDRSGHFILNFENVSLKHGG